MHSIALRELFFDKKNETNHWGFRGLPNTTKERSFVRMLRSRYLLWKRHQPKMNSPLDTYSRLGSEEYSLKNMAVSLVTTISLQSASGAFNSFKSRAYRCIKSVCSCVWACLMSLDGKSLKWKNNNWLNASVIKFLNSFVENTPWGNVVSYSCQSTLMFYASKTGKNTPQIEHPI